MKLQIGKHNYDLHFGIKFIRTMDKRHGITFKQLPGMSFGMGLAPALQGLAVNDPAALADIISAAASPRVGQDEVDDYLDSLNDKDYDALFKRVSQELEDSKRVNSFIKALNKAGKN